MKSKDKNQSKEKRVISKFLFSLFLMALVIFSLQCKKENVKSISNDLKVGEIVNSQSYSNLEDSFFVELDIARIYAQWMNASDTSYHGETQRTIISEYPIEDENEIPCMWVFNYADNGGWVILSADYRHEPIMAYNNEGCFASDTIPGGLGMWIDASIERIGILRSGDYDNTFKGLNAWQTTQNEYGTLAHLSGKKPMPTDGEDPQNPLCIRGIRQVKGPLLETTWGQECTYNNLTPSCTTSCGHAPTGCVATAIAQVMQYFHKSGSIFDYSIMPLHHGNSEVSKLMEDIGGEVSMNYGCDRSGTPFDDYKNILKTAYSYANCEGKTYNLTELISNISNNKPVILNGCDQQAASGKKWWNFFKPKYNYSTCHAWDCDGVTSIAYCNYTTISTLHMNWGWYEVNPITLLKNYWDHDYNGWYYYNNWYIPGYNWNFHYSNSMVCSIQP